MSTENIQSNSDKHLTHKKIFCVAWIFLVCGLIYSTIVVGGLTRLTGSGLSMVEWQPIHGVIPPITQQEWTEEFGLYQKTPEYIKKNASMSLAEFKFIFYWEYAHRILGRLIGLVYFLPLIFLQFSGFLKELSIRTYGSARRLPFLLWIGFFLGGLQGLLGWYMVKSGLVNVPEVSHYRLAAHLGLAFFIVAYLAWILLDVLRGTKPLKIRSLVISSRVTGLLLITLFFQIIYGAFTAGLKAGYNYNTFPLMKGQFVPEGLLAMTPTWINFTENLLTVQFIHRGLAWLLLFLVLVLLAYFRKRSLSRSQKRGLDLLVGVLVFQFVIGVLTLLNYVPLSLATLHQSGGFFLMLSTLYFMHTLKKTNA